MPFDPTDSRFATADTMAAPHNWDAPTTAIRAPKPKPNYVWQALLVSLLVHGLFLLAFAVQKIKTLSLIKEPEAQLVVPIILYERVAPPKIAAPAPKEKVAEPAKADPLRPVPRTVEAVAPTAITHNIEPTEPKASKETTPEAKATAETTEPAKATSEPAKAAYDLGGYYNKVATKLNRAKTYPFEARQKKVTGTVKIAFVIHRDGHISGVRVAQSSGSDLLDQAALKALEKSAPFEPLPLEANKDSVPMVWACQFTLK